MSETLDNNQMMQANFTSKGEVVQKMTAPLPAISVGEVEYFTCTAIHHSLIRNDGKKIAFIWHVCATNDFHDIKYISDEIAAGNPYLRKATKEEIDQFKMRVDPKGTIAEQIRPEIEQKVRATLEQELQESMLHRLSAIGISLNKEQQEKLYEASVREALDADRQKIAGVDADSQQKINQAIVNLGNATLVMPPGKLGGISGTDKLPNAAASNFAGKKG